MFSLYGLPHLQDSLDIAHIHGFHRYKSTSSYYITVIDRRGWLIISTLFSKTKIPSIVIQTVKQSMITIILLHYVFSRTQTINCLTV